MPVYECPQPDDTPDLRAQSTHGLLSPSLTTMTTDFADRPSRKLCLFDVDGTLTLARQVSQFIDLLRTFSNQLLIYSL